MKVKNINISGKLLARKKSNVPRILFYEIVRIEREFRPRGPAENSILMVENYKSGERRAKYIPWVGYFDIDREITRNPKVWKIIEPSKQWAKKNISWIPFR